MKVCLISNQIAAWGKIGGFGTATRAIGGGLAQQGIEVSAVVPLRADYGQKPFEQLDGIKVYGTSYWKTLTSGEIFKEIGADIYHSQEPTIATYLAQRARPDAIHIVTCRDPRGLRDHFIELLHTNNKRRLLSPINTWYYEASPWVKKSVRQADMIFTPAPTCLHERIRSLYGRSLNPVFVPSPVDLPPSPPRKAEKPTFLFVGRWDRRKRIERFFELARMMPACDFIAVGNAHDSAYDAFLRRAYGDIPNLSMPGFVPRFGSPGVNEYYEKAWALINTSAREGLPYTFLESLAYECAIVSCLNPEDFSTKYGYFMEDGDFEKGINFLLQDPSLKERVTKGAELVRATFNLENSIKIHLDYYHKLLRGKNPVSHRPSVANG